MGKDLLYSMLSTGSVHDGELRDVRGPPFFGMGLMSLFLTILKPDLALTDWVRAVLWYQRWISDSQLVDDTP